MQQPVYRIPLYPRVHAGVPLTRRFYGAFNLVQHKGKRGSRVTDHRAKSAPWLGRCHVRRAKPGARTLARPSKRRSLPFGRPTSRTTTRAREISNTQTRPIEQSSHPRRYEVIETVIHRSATTIGRFCRGETHQAEKPKGRKRCSSVVEDTAVKDWYVELKLQAHLDGKPREGLVEEARVKAEFPGSYHTVLRRTKSAKLNETYRRERPRETPLDTVNDRPNRLHWAEWYAEKDASFWEEEAIFVDCKRFAILLSAYQKYHTHTATAPD